MAPVVLVVGESGSGKSRLLRELEERPPANRLPLYVPISTLGFEDLATWCLVSLGHATEADARSQLRAELVEGEDAVLLLIDDADHLPADTAAALGELAASVRGRLAIVAATCPGPAEPALATSLRTPLRVVLGEQTGSLVYLREVHDLLELRGRPGASALEPRRRDTPPAPAIPDTAPELDGELELHDEMELLDMELHHELELDEGPDVDLDLEASKLGEAAGLERREGTLRSAAPPFVGAPPPSPAPRPDAVPAVRAVPVRVVATLLAACLLIGVAYALGRRSVELEATAATTAAEPPAPAVAADDATDEPAPARRDPLPPVGAAPVAVPESTIVVGPAAATEPGLADVEPSPEVGPPPPTAPAPAAGEPPAAPAPYRSRVARANDGWIDIEVIGDGPAEVFIDWQRVGMAPVSGEAVAPRRHVVTLVQPDGTRLRKTVDVEPNQRSTVRFYLD